MYIMAALTWDEICERALEYKKVVIEEVSKQPPYGKKKIKFKCLGCDCIYVQFTKNLFSWSCLKCSMTRLKESNFLVLEEKLYELSKEKDFQVLEYVGIIYKQKVHHWKIKCNICGFESVKALFTLKRDGCHGCQIEKSKSNTIDFISKAKIVHGDKFDYSLTSYIAALKKVKIICLKCNNIFSQQASNHLTGAGCPFCKESKGEIAVAKYLNQKNITFNKQKTFKDLIDISLLKFDFYLPGLNLLIEYDGEGHYIACFGTTVEEKQKNLKNTQRRDKLKDEYAKANNIPLLRIPYWDFNRIEELIEAFISEVLRQRGENQISLDI